MTANNPQSNPGERQDRVITPSAQPASARIATSTTPNGATKAWAFVVIALLGGLVAALLTWGILQAAYPFYQANAELKIAAGAAMDAESAQRGLASQRQTDRVNTSAVLALFGFLLGGLMAFPAAFRRRSFAGQVAAFLACGACAALAGAGMGFAWRPFTDWLSSAYGVDRTVAIVTSQAAVWTSVGLVIGLVLGTLNRSSMSTLGTALGGAMGGLLAGLLWPLVMAFLFPLLRTDVGVPASRIAQFLWLILPAALISLSAALATNMNLRRPPKTVGSHQV